MRIYAGRYGNYGWMERANADYYIRGQHISHKVNEAIQKIYDWYGFDVKHNIAQAKMCDKQLKLDDEHNMRRCQILVLCVRL